LAATQRVARFAAIRLRARRESRGRPAPTA